MAKPVANSIKTQAKSHPKFKAFCISVAQVCYTNRIKPKAMRLTDLPGLSYFRDDLEDEVLGL